MLYIRSPGVIILTKVLNPPDFQTILKNIEVAMFTEKNMSICCKIQVLVQEIVPK